MEGKEKPVLITQRMQLLLPLYIVASQGQNPGYDLLIKHQAKIHLGQPKELPSSFHSVTQSKGPCHIQLKGILTNNSLKETSNKRWSIDETRKAFCLLLRDPGTKKASLI